MIEKDKLTYPLKGEEIGKFVASYEGNSQMDNDTIVKINLPDDICDILEDVYNNHFIK